MSIDANICVIWRNSKCQSGVSRVSLTPSHVGPTAAIVAATAEGVATKADIDVETLEQRLFEEREALATTTVGEVMFGATARPSVLSVEASRNPTDRQ